ncbi:DUF1090 domain-containing protein [Halomonas borealis]|uniref:DUF1090 domain-containing protein n=1 Tax=Halomonas borealis TaxID=2508710 RepID=UPI0010A0883A|nr:DUF1090 domain-containing protein [Halomonas borealis]
MLRMTRDVSILMLCAMPTAFSPSAVAEDSLDSLCQAKVEDIQAQRQAAEQDGNEHRVRGLTRALDEVTQHCTNDGVLEDAEQDVRESMAEVRERQADLDDAQQAGDADDIRERSRKLEEAVTELEADQRELEALDQQP